MFTVQYTSAFSEPAVNMFLFLYQNAIKSMLTHLWINELKE